MVTPLAFVVDTDALLSFARSFDLCSVGFDDGAFEELIGLLLPNFLTDTIEGTHQAEHVSVIEPATEVACGGWVGNAMGADRVEISFILSPVFEVIQAVATGEKIQRNV